MKNAIMPTHPSTHQNPQPSPAHVKALRSFNRFYTQRIGVLSPYLDSKFTLTEVRVLYELAHHTPQVAPLTATSLARELGLDMGYLSRILRRFESRQWITRSPSPDDARQSLLALTQAGYEVFAPLQQKSRDDAARLLASVPAVQQAQVVAAMGTIEALLQPDPGESTTSPMGPELSLRDPRPGDMGWVVQQHGEIYAREYGWNSDFEALVADIVANYLRKFQPEWERCWIAELDGQRVGSVFVVRKSKNVAQLRMLILTPEARGLGLGARLTDECITFARAKGYKKMLLWTNSCLDAARALYARRGFKIIKSVPYEGFGQNPVGETWELLL
jgi:DNA-binding MarR family transcriptional regulator/GNAT superfamily N-acetyltransferase